MTALADDAMTASRHIAWSCLVDDTPSIWAGIQPWIVTATEIARISPAHLHVHHVCDLKPEVRDLCRQLGVATHNVETFDRRFPHTNKIRQCWTDYGDVARVVLMDVDMVFAGLPPIGDVRSPLAGKPVDLPNPPVHVLQKVFRAAGVPAPERCISVRPAGNRTSGSFMTYPGNFNGGLYVLDPAVMGLIGPAWAARAQWLIRNIGLLEDWAVHVDQVAFCLAAHELTLETVSLDDTWNYPLHLQDALPGAEPFVIHHHAPSDVEGHLDRLSVGRTKRAVQRVLGALRAASPSHAVSPDEGCC